MTFNYDDFKILQKQAVKPVTKGADKKQKQTKTSEESNPPILKKEKSPLPQESRKEYTFILEDPQEIYDKEIEEQKKRDTEDDN